MLLAKINDSMFINPAHIVAVELINNQAIIHLVGGRVVNVEPDIIASIQNALEVHDHVIEPKATSSKGKK